MMMRKATHSQEDYLEAILNLLNEKKTARIVDIAKRVGVGKSSASIAVKKLQSKGLTNHDSYGSVTLTREGNEIASQIVRRHIAFKDFFMNRLGLPEEIAEEDACNMEHYASPKLVDRLLKYLDFAKHCPFGKIGWDQEQGFHLSPPGEDDGHRD